MMAASRSKSDQPDRGWNDPPMFNYSPTAGASPKRQLNKRVAYPMSGSGHPGHAVLDPSKGPPILNPVLTPSLNANVPQQPKLVMSAGLSNTALGSEDLPPSPVLLLPPTSDTATPTPVPVLVPVLVPGIVTASTVTAGDRPGQPGVADERVEDLLSRLHLDGDGQLLEHTAGLLSDVLTSLKGFTTLKDIADVEKKRIVGYVYLSDEYIPLKNGETDTAQHLHLVLIVDHPAEVIPWMGAAKKLIEQQQLATKEKQLLLETDCAVPPGGEATCSQGEVILEHSHGLETAEEVSNDCSSIGEEIEKHSGDTQTVIEKSCDN